MIQIWSRLISEGKITENANLLVIWKNKIVHKKAIEVHEIIHVHTVVYELNALVWMCFH